MKDRGRPSNKSARHRLLKLVTSEFDDAGRAYDLLAEFLPLSNGFSKSLCSKLIEVARDRAGTAWDVRRLAVLMLQHQASKIRPDDLSNFNFLLAQLNLKESSAPNAPVVSAMLKEGYSTTYLHRFIPQFRRRLQRLERTYARIRGWKTSEAALQDFINASRHECKLSLARYLFTADEVVDEILRQVLVTNGATDFDSTQPVFVAAERERAISRLPEYEASILEKLCTASQVYWVAKTTGSEINSLIEYPLTTVVLVIKPPGSDVEFEIKRAGKRSPLSLNIVYGRNGYAVAPSHRLDGGNMLWLLRHEATAAARLSRIYRLVHGNEAPLPGYISRSNISSVPANGDQVQTLTYFTEPGVFGESFPEMRKAMAASVAAFKAEGYLKLPDLPGELGLTAQFISIVCPGQAILTGTSSFRLDRVAGYLADDGAVKYFEQGSKIAYSTHAARRFADEILEEILGVYKPPTVRSLSYGRYLAAAFAVPENRARADSVYRSLLIEIGTLWGTLMGVKGYTRGESFVARNVGLRSVWEGGRWNVRIVFMDHDSVVIPNYNEKDFCAPEAVPNMRLDEIYIWGQPGSLIGSVGYLRSIYRISDEGYERARVDATIAMRKAYQKTQHELSRNPKLQRLFDPQFIKRLLDWNKLVKSYLRQKPNTAPCSSWKDKTKAVLAKKGYAENETNDYLEALETNRAFLERYPLLFDPKGRS